MAAYGAGDVVAGVGNTDNLPNFVGEMFKLSPIDTPLLTLIGGLTGGLSARQSVFTWQDTIHRSPALQSIAEGADATFGSQKRNERRNVTAIHQYGVELTYTKQSSTGLLGSTGATPDIAATSILGNQPVQDEMSWQLQIKIEQAALDVELMFLTGTFTYPASTAARQTQGVVGVVDAATTTNWTATSGQTVDRTVINDLSKKLFDNGAKMQNCILMVPSLGKVDIGNAYALSSTGWNIQPRSYSVFGVNVTDIETEFARYPVVVNRHLDVNTALILELDILGPCFLPMPGKGHFFLEPLAKSGSYDRAQLYGDIGLKYGPAGWHAKAHNLHAV